MSAQLQTPTPQASSAATDFIKLLFEPGDLLCFGFQNAETKRWTQAFRTYENSLQPETMESLVRANEAGHNIYIAMNTYKTPSRKEADIAAIRNVWAEIDEDGRANLDKIFASRSVPDPTVVNESSPSKFHAIWKVKDMSVEDAKVLLKSICAEFNGDKNAIDAARVLRLPGFKNWKYTDQPEVEIVHLSENTSAHTASEFALVPKKATVTSIDAALAPTASNVFPKKSSKTDEELNLIANDFVKRRLPEGSIEAGSGHDSFLHSVAGKLREEGGDEEQILQILIRVCEEVCTNYGPDYIQMCEKHAHYISEKPVGDDTRALIGGKLPSEAIVQSAKTIKSVPAEEPQNWRDLFKTRGELPDGGLRMLIDGFLPEGINFIGALPGHGKTQFALSMCKALTTGSPFLGKYKSQQLPVLYLIPESSGNAFKMRLELFGIPDDEKLFLCRTISEGKVLRLDNPGVLAAVAAMKPIVFLDTMIRFSEAADENSSAENRIIAGNIIDLRIAGAPAVVALHHSTKDLAKSEITLENCLRGTGDIAALADSVYALRRDSILYDNKNGPEELEVICVKDRDIKNPPQPFRIALRYKKEDGTLGSLIDETGDIQIVEPAVAQAALERNFVKLVTENPTISQEELQEALRLTKHAAGVLKRKLGWSRSMGRYGVWSFGPATKPESPAATMKRKKEEAQAAVPAPAPAQVAEQTLF